MRTVVQATVLGGALSTLALAAAAVLEGVAPAQPLNATAHWRFGDDVAGRRTVDVEHTGTGFATHMAATGFWAVLHGWWLQAQPLRGPVDGVTRAVKVAALAAVVDYTMTPKRFTPGWELVLSKTGMALAYAGMAAGFALAAQADR